MREDIKKKFLDILFEPEEVEKRERVVAKAPLEDVRPKRTEEVKKVEPTPQVQVKKTAFINVDNSSKDEEDINIEISQIKEKINNKDYEFTQNISPIFGVVDKPKKADEPKVLTDDSQTSKPSSSYLGTIISPIFGYDANKSTNTFENYKEEMDGLRNRHSSNEESSDPFDDTMSLNRNSFKEEVVDNTVINEEHIEEEVKTEDRIDDIVNIEPEDEYYSPDDEQLFKELSISDIFKTEEEIKDNKEEEKVSYTSLFDNKED